MTTINIDIKPFPSEMYFTDTHTHLFLPEFSDDYHQVIQNAIDNNVRKMVLPNIDDLTLAPLLSLCSEFPEYCYPLIGLHPGSVNENYKTKLSKIEETLSVTTVAGIGEIGLDYYWDIGFKKQQIEVFEIQLEWAKTLGLPVAIHVRNSFDDVLHIVEKHAGNKLKGVFHCFTGNIQQAQKVIEFGFYLGIGGIITFKNSGLDQILNAISPEHILLETDSPYLSPVPFRGKRNESSYIPYIASKVAEIYTLTQNEIMNITTGNALKLFTNISTIKTGHLKKFS